MPDIKPWADIEDEFDSTLLLGNGASMAVDACFSYNSLLNTARSLGAVTTSLDNIFAYLGTEDFELVLRMLRATYHINAALGIKEKAPREAYTAIRNALVSAVREVHPAYETVQPHLRSMHRFMKRFNTVLSLNYDLIAYWAMLDGNREYDNWFKDCFVNGEFDDDWKRMREPYGASGATLVFYPHGNLVLGTDLLGAESKISVERDWDRLLGTILRSWNDNDRIPLFVSEGESQQKHSAIARSGYLSTVYNDVMNHLGADVVILGCQLSEVDDHIVKRIASGGRRIAKSVYRHGRTAAAINKECADFLYRVNSHSTTASVEFFDATSPGCWIS